MTYKSRMGELLRRQEAVRRARGRYVIVTMVLLIVGGSIVYTELREFDLLWGALMTPLVLFCAWGAWRCGRVAMTLNALYTDAHRLSAMSSTEELPTLRETLFSLGSSG